jgi:hypothetical protein
LTASCFDVRRRTSASHRAAALSRIEMTRPAVSMNLFAGRARRGLRARVGASMKAAQMVTQRAREGRAYEV